MVTKVKLQRWAEHLKRAAASGVPLARYARDHGISEQTLYAARHQQRALQRTQEQIRTQAQSRQIQKAQSNQSLTTRNAFVAIKLPEPDIVCAAQADTFVSAHSPTVLQAHLPNGVALSIGIPPCDQTQHQPLQPAWTQVLHALAALPCSR
jgi:hypothetical protein